MRAWDDLGSFGDQPALRFLLESNGPSWARKSSPGWRYGIRSQARSPLTFVIHSIVLFRVRPLLACITKATNAVAIPSVKVVFGRQYTLYPLFSSWA
jgi:hypothetical protein